LEELSFIEKDVRLGKLASVTICQKQNPAELRLTAGARLMLQEIPANPGHECWQQGNTLGPDFRMWKRAKFGQNRFRLFFRYDSSAKVIIFVWVNNENTLRKEGDKNDPYAIFEKSLQKGDPPSDLKELLKRGTEVKSPESSDEPNAEQS
jgi:toxin YhaV